MDQLMEVWNYFISHGSVSSKLRSIVGVVFLITFSRQYLKIRKARKQITLEDEEQMIKETYEQDENGHYPWEVDTDDSPNRISNSATRLVNDWAPKRGRWR